MSARADDRAPARALPRVPETAVAVVLISLLLALLVVVVALPLGSLLSKAFQTADGTFAGLSNFGRYFQTPALVRSLVNSLWVSLLATAIVVPLAFAYAYALTRSCMPFKGAFTALALLPIFAPSLLPALSLVYLFGNQGLLRDLLLGHSIYGPIGIVIAQVFYCFPHALMIMTTALSLTDGRLYEAAEALGTTRARVFRTITLPGVAYGVVSAAFVVFTLAITDFGIPKVIGGQFAVLATDAYRQVIGQQNFEMGAVVGLILLVPALAAFVVDRLARRRQVALLSARAVPYVPRPSAGRDLGALAFCAVVALLLLGLVAVAVWASFIRFWPYDLSLTLQNYAFQNFEPNGWSVYLVSLEMAAFTALFGTALVFAGAYAVEKLKPFPAGRLAAHLLAMLPMAVPGLVLGLGYVFFFNAPWNPLNIVYGTMAILVMNSIAHFYTVAHVTAVTALKQIDAEFEAVSASLKVPFWTTFRRVTVPICLPAIVDIAIYLFVNALTTVSAVIFLYGATTKLAAVSIVHMDEAGFIASAAAMASLIVVTAIAAKIVHLILDRVLLARLQAWRRR
jgi:iron(III) transport system permease protein